MRAVGPGRPKAAIANPESGSTSSAAAVAPVQWNSPGSQPPKAWITAGVTVALSRGMYGGVGGESARAVGEVLALG